MRLLPTVRAWVCVLVVPLTPLRLDNYSTVGRLPFLTVEMGGHRSEGSYANYTSSWVKLLIICGFL